MNATLLNERKYKRLLGAALSAVIQTEEEYQRLLAATREPSDLSSVLPKSRVSEILSGKRGISKSQAKRLAEFFRVPVEVFL